MGIVSAATNLYVRFVRGTSAAFANLTVKNDDTLYFIYDPGEQYGRLYLGEVEISKSVSESLLGDVIINTLGNLDLLVYDLAQDAWVNKPVSEIVGVMVGATATTNGVSGLVPVPVKGDEIKFLSGAGNWSKVPAGSLQFDSNIFAANTNGELTIAGLSAVSGNNNFALVFKLDEVPSLQPIYTKSEIDTLLNRIGQLKRKVVNSVEDIENDIEALENEAFLNYLYMVPNGSGSVGNLYDEYLVIKNDEEYAIEKISSSSTEVDLTNYLQVDDFNDFKAIIGDMSAFSTSNPFMSDYNSFKTAVGDLSQLTLSTDDLTNLVEEVNYLAERLTWNELVSK